VVSTDLSVTKEMGGPGHPAPPPGASVRRGLRGPLRRLPRFRRQTAEQGRDQRDGLRGGVHRPARGGWTGQRFEERAERPSTPPGRARTTSAHSARHNDIRSSRQIAGCFAASERLGDSGVRPDSASIGVHATGRHPGAAGQRARRGRPRVARTPAHRTAADDVRYRGTSGDRGHRAGAVLAR
jgi:hypothetical protein